MRRRIAILGNSGSGKTHLARRIAADLDVPAIGLDGIFWLPGGFVAKRPPEEVDRLIAEFRSERAWVVEGVFGDLVARFLDLADILLWLDLPWEVCHASLLSRGPESSKGRAAVEAEESFRKLLIWSSEYWVRTDLRSHDGHERIYDEFPREKRRFTERSQVDEFIRNAVGRQVAPSEMTA